MGNAFQVSVHMQKGKPPQISASGTSQHPITSEEKKAFGLNDAKIKQGVGNNFGKEPSDVFLCDPTPWGDIYSRYGWEPVQSVATVERYEVLGVSSEPLILTTKRLQNHSNNKASFSAALTQQVSNTIETNWSQSHNVSMAQSISYNFIVNGKTSISYNGTWGRGGSKSETITVGDHSGVEIKLNPGQSARAVLSTKRSVVRIRVFYKVYLTGSVFANYCPTYKDHHFWNLDINE